MERYFKYIKLVLIYLIVGITGCTNLKSDKKIGLDIDLDLAGENADGLITVSGTDDSFEWQGNAIAKISYWDNEGNEQSQDVTPANGWQLKRESTENGFTVNCANMELEFSFKITLIPDNDILSVSVPSTDILETGKGILKSLRLLPLFGAAKEGDEGYIFLSQDVGILCYYKGKEAEEHMIPVYAHKKCNMPIFGMVKDNRGITGIIIGGQYDARICLSTKWGEKDNYGVDPEFVLRKFKEETRLPDDIIVDYHFLSPDESDWLGAAKRYRQYNFDHRDIRPLKERAKESPELAYSSGALEVRLRMGVKPVPCDVPEQTPETEPAVRVFLTFPKVRDIFDEFHNQGIGHAEFCIVGWHKSGHDGRFPQLFPVEEVFGGEEELRKTIAYGQSLGYQIVSHDCYEDAYTVSEDWDEEFIRKKPDGELWSSGVLAGGRRYFICRERAYELFAKRDEPKVRDLGFKGLHYNDVLSIVGPKPCYDSRHPLTHRQDVEFTNKILALSKQLFGGVQSEGALDFAAPVLDRALYITINSKNSSMIDLPYVDELIPLFSAVYHGVMLYNIWNDCVNSGPGDTAYLKNIEYGGVPVAYFYGHFWLDPERNWLGDKDLHYDSPEGLKEDVAGLKKVYDDFRKLHHLQMEFVEGHKELAEGVFITEYSNGQSVVVNYNEDKYTLASGHDVPARGFYLLDDTK